jgi:hypothetical protein
MQTTIHPLALELAQHVLVHERPAPRADARDGAQALEDRAPALLRVLLRVPAAAAEERRRAGEARAAPAGTRAG